jgi:putative glycosyl hydrolase protein
VLVGLLKRVDEAIGIPIGTDVFGVTAFHEGDRDGLGQLPEKWAAHVDVFTHMLYLDGMSSWRPRGGNPRAERLIYAAIKNLRRRLGSGPVLRPFLQAFARGADYYNEAFIAEQIRGSRDAGADGFLFWSPSSSYRMVQSSMAGAARGLLPFPIDERLAWRRHAWGESGAAPADEGAPTEDAAPAPEADSIVAQSAGASAPASAGAASSDRLRVDVVTRPSRRMPAGTADKPGSAIE